MYGALAAELRPGVPERDALAEAPSAGRQFGCLDGIALMGRPPFKLFGAGSEVPLQRDDVIVIDLEWARPYGVLAGATPLLQLRQADRQGPPLLGAAAGVLRRVRRRDPPGVVIGGHPHGPRRRLRRSRLSARAQPALQRARHRARLARAALGAGESDAC